MRERNSKQLVVDADVAQASGSENATASRAIHCRDFLINIRSICHRVVMTERINSEWKNHHSRFARRWLVSMKARRKIVKIDPSKDTTLREIIKNTTHDENKIDVLLKDIHLLEAAMKTDNIIISLDETVRKLFANVAQSVGEIRDIIWVNPERTEEEIPIKWLEDGSPPESYRKLSTYISK